MLGLCYIVLLGGLGFKFRHLLVALSFLESMGILVFLSVGMLSMFGYMAGYALVIYMVVMVCESVLGLGLLVRLVRDYGVDYIYAMSLG